MTKIKANHIVEAHALFHLPWFTSGGVDVKAGQYVTLEGAEVIYAPDNLLYTHSYIFNFGIPFKHTGVMTTTHLNSVVDIYAGIDTGVNTTFGNSFNCLDCGDNNKAAAFHGGIGLNLGALTVLGTTHIGPENPNVSAVVLAGVNPNSALRYLNDVTATWKVNDKLTLITDLNYARDDVGSFPGNLDFVKFEHGDPTAVAFFGGTTTYAAFTLGLNIKPTVPKELDGLVIRPEIRYDTSLNGTTPFGPLGILNGTTPVPGGAGTKSSQFTFSSDIIIPFKVK